MSTAISPTVWSEIMASKSSPETIAALLNEAEAKHSSTPRHFNQKRVYPFWKACENCGKPYPTNNHTQALRSRLCGRECISARVKQSRRKMPLAERKGRFVACVVCGTEVWKPDAWLRQVSQHTCSRRCNGKVRAVELAKHSHKGRGGWTEASYESCRQKMTGENNPAWKGGLTYRKRKGAYADQSIRYVRCPEPLLAMARKDGYVMEHRLIMAQALGRALTRTECVHHANHDATDNRLENLMLFATNADHKRFEHGQGIVPLWCGLCHSTTPARSGACVCPPAHS